MSEAGRAAAGWRVAARLARREVRRRPWRSALVVTLIALPVGGVTFAAIFARTTTPTAAERRSWDFGHADDVVTPVDVFDGSPVDDAESFADTVGQAYPPGSRIVLFSEAQDAATGSDGHLHIVIVTDRPLDDPLVAGSVELTDGRAPERADEVAVSEAALDATDTAIGDRIDLLLSGEVTVTGVVDAPTCNNCELVVGTEMRSDAAVSRYAFVDAPPGFSGPDTATLAAGNAHSWSVAVPYFAYADDVTGRLALIYVVGGVALAGAAVIAAAAFAIAARRQLRLLGLLSASGVPPNGLRQTVLLQGSTAGLLGSVVGVTLGLVGMAVARPLLDEISSSYVGPLEVHPLDLLGPLALGVVAATAAAWLPAHTAAQVPVLAALAGRKPQSRLPTWIPVAGVIAAGLGVVGLGFLAGHPNEYEWGHRLIAALAVLFGGTALAPWIVTHTAPLARRLRGGARVALRDLARQRLRSGAVVAAVMVPAGLSVLTATSAVTDDARDRSSLDDSLRSNVQPDQALVSAVGGDATPPEALSDELGRVRAILPGAHEIDVWVALSSPGAALDAVAQLEIDDPTAPVVSDLGKTNPETRWLVVNDPRDLAEAGAPAAVVDALDDGKVVLFAPSLPPEAQLAILGAEVAIDRDDVLVADLAVPSRDSIAVIAPETATRWGLSELYYSTLFQASRPLTEQQRDEIQAVFEGCDYDDPACQDQHIREDLLGLPTDGPDGSVEVHRPASDAWSPLLLHLGLAAGSLAVTLPIVAVALALTSAESRDERALLDAIGAPPRVRRAITAWQAGLLPAMAMVLAVPGGLAVAYAVKRTGYYSGSVGVQVPWLALGLIALGVPVISAGVAWLGSTLAGRRRRDLSALALAAD